MATIHLFLKYNINISPEPSLPEDEWFSLLNESIAWMRLYQNAINNLEKSL